ncbi:MAG: hypothetical protein M1834_002096 [Cirrosporium novae-zelandiae]|nr:MAG: hypothetical protein M1834_002096 [Cirrosporium novae-zelandiae]
MSTSNSLYGAHNPKSSKTKEISSSANLSFTSQLSSLIASSSGAQIASAHGRPRPSKSKSSIFTTHNKNTKKRAMADEEDSYATQKHKSQADLGGAVDEATLHRSKRRMEEKAKRYAEMKRGEYVGSDGRLADDRGLVDFDRKWAEKQARGGRSSDSSSDSDSSFEHDSDTEVKASETVEYEDEFGRLRTGTQAEASREARKQKAQTAAAEEAASFSARPQQPTNLIFGDTIQSSAFNPSEPVAAQMDKLAQNRDRSPTPPEDSHYDAGGEIRSKGVGFYGFSQDNEERKGQLEALERERRETERGKVERVERKERRKREIEERRAKIREQRGVKQAEAFLEGLGEELAREG